MRGTAARAARPALLFSGLVTVALGLGAVHGVTAGPARPPAEASAKSSGLGVPVRVPAGSRAGQDLLALRADVIVDGEAAGDAVALHGDVVVRGRLAGDALAIHGRVRVESGGEVAGNAFALFGGVELAPGARVQGRTRSLAELPAGTGSGYLSLCYAKPVLIFRFLFLLFWLLAALVATFVAPTTVARAASELRRHPLRLTGIGLLLASSLVLLAVLAVALIPVFVGIPLLVLLALAATGLQAVALAAAFHAVGERVAERLREGAITAYVEVLAGALVFGLLHFVPVVGELAWLFASLAGAGSAVATRLGRSEPRRLGRAA